MGLWHGGDQKSTRKNFLHSNVIIFTWLKGNITEALMEVRIVVEFGINLKIGTGWGRRLSRGLLSVEHVFYLEA